jgi:hypothetical protein
MPKRIDPKVKERCTRLVLVNRPGNWCSPGLVEFDYWILHAAHDRRAAWEDLDIHQSSAVGSSI